MNYLPEKLVNLRKHYKYSQDALAQFLGMDVVDYMGLENGRRLPTYRQMLKLAELYDIEVIEIFKNSPEVTLHKTKSTNTDQVNLEYFMKQKSLPNRLINLIKHHPIISVLVVCILAAMIFILMPKKQESIELVCEDKNRLDASNTTIVYIDEYGAVKGSGDSSNRKLADLPSIDAIKVQEGTSFTAVLLKDGTVKGYGLLDKYQSELEKWHNIVDIAANGEHLLGLSLEGKVYCVGEDYCDIKEFEKIKTVYAFNKSSICIDDTGNAGYTGEIVGSALLKKYRNIKDIDSSDNITVVLLDDGTVDYACYKNDHYIKATSWKNIVDVACGEDFIAGLDANGNVKIVIENNMIADEVETWNDIICIASGDNYLVGYDGKDIYGVGVNDYEQFKTNDDSKTITLSEVTGIQVSTGKEEITITFNKVEHSEGYQVSINAGTGISKYSNENKISFPVDYLNDGSTYVIRVVAIGKGDYSNSRVAQYNYEYHVYKEELTDDDIVFPVWHNIGKSEDDFLDYLKSYGVMDDHIIKSESDEPCQGDGIYITKVEGYEDGEKMNRKALQKINIEYQYCRLEANGE